MKNKSDDIQLLTFGGHLEMLRKMLFRIVLVIVVFTILIFSFKEWTFQLLLAPREWNFATYLKSATPFPKCYLHKEKWTFDS